MVRTLVTLGIALGIAGGSLYAEAGTGTVAAAIAAGRSLVVAVAARYGIVF